MKRSSQPAGKSLAPLEPAAAEARPRRCKALFAELSNYLDEQLDDSLCEELEKHLDGCEPCKAFLASLESTIASCRNLLPDSLDARKAAKLRKQILEDYRKVVIS